MDMDTLQCVYGIDCNCWTVFSMLECIDLFPQPLSTQDGLGGKNTLYDVIVITFL